MTNLKTQLCLLFVLLAVAAQAGPSEEAKAKRTLQRAQRQLKTVEKQLVSRPQPGPFEIDSWNKKLEKSRQFMEQARAIMNGENGSNSESQSLLSTVEQQYQKVSKQVANSSGEVQAAQNLATGDGAQQAIGDYEKLAEAYLRISQWVLSPEVNDPEMMKLYTETQKAEEFLDRKYATVLGRRDRASFPLTAAAQKADNNKMAVEMRTQALLQQGPAMVDQLLNEAQQASESLQRTGAFAGWETSVEQKLEHAELMAEKMNLLAPGDPRSQAAAAKVSSKMAPMNSVKQKFRAQVIASNKMPADRYGGGDAAQLKSLVKQKWQGKFPQDQVLQVVIADSSWSAFSGTEWVSSARKWQSYDYDRMKALVKVAGSGSYNYKFAAFIVRQNLQGGTIDILTARPDNPENNPTNLLTK